LCKIRDISTLVSSDLTNINLQENKTLSVELA